MRSVTSSRRSAYPDAMVSTLRRLVLALTLTACGAESPTPQAPTDASALADACPQKRRIGTVTLDGGVCVYTCPSGFVGCPGLGCEERNNGGGHCEVCGVVCPVNTFCDRRPDASVYRCLRPNE